MTLRRWGAGFILLPRGAYRPPWGRLAPSQGLALSHGKHLLPSVQPGPMRHLLCAKNRAGGGPDPGEEPKPNLLRSEWDQQRHLTAGSGDASGLPGLAESTLPQPVIQGVPGDLNTMPSSVFRGAVSSSPTVPSLAKAWKASHCPSLSPIFLPPV